MSARRVLVTGATGFLGGAVAARLHAAGDEVTATGRDLAAGEALRARGLNFVAADLTDAAAVDRLCADHSHVVHCAARAASGCMGSDTDRMVTLASSCLASANPCSSPLRASSDPSVATRMCLYM